MIFLFVIIKMTLSCKFGITFIAHVGFFASMKPQMSFKIAFFVKLFPAIRYRTNIFPFPLVFFHMDF